MTLVYIQGRIYSNDRGFRTFITLLVSFNSIYRGRVVQYHTWLITLKTGANPWLRNQLYCQRKVGWCRDPGYNGNVGSIPILTAN